jgi:CheY-like chemotaxis protein
MTDTAIWSSALVAAGCTAVRAGGREPVDWRITSDQARYTAGEAVVVEPFGIALSPGDSLNVTWHPGNTGYSIAVKSGTCSKGGRPRFSTSSRRPLAVRQSPDRAAGLAAGPTKHGEMMNEKRILIVDDHVAVRKGLAAALTDCPDFQACVKTSSGRQAVAAVAQLKPDVVIMDTSIPEMNGPEATRQMVASNPKVQFLSLPMDSSRQFLCQVLLAVLDARRAAETNAASGRIHRRGGTRGYRGKNR